MSRLGRIIEIRTTLLSQKMFANINTLRTDRTGGNGIYIVCDMEFAEGVAALVRYMYIHDHCIVVIIDYLFPIVYNV